MTRFIIPSILVAPLALIGCAKNTNVATAPDPSTYEQPDMDEGDGSEEEDVFVKVSEVPAAHAEGAMLAQSSDSMPADARPLGRPTSTKAYPSILRATDSKVAAQELSGLMPPQGQVWQVEDPDIDATEGLDAVADGGVVGAADFDSTDAYDDGTWAVGCVRLRGETIAVQPQTSGDVDIYPVMEVVPGTLWTAKSAADAETLKDGVGCDNLAQPTLTEGQSLDR